MKLFYQLLANTLFVSVTNFTVWFGITFFTFLETQSVFATGIISGIFLVLTASLGFWFGSLVDNHQSKPVLLGSSAVTFIFYLLGFLIYLAAPDSAFKKIESVWLWGLVVTVMLGVIVGNIRAIALPALITVLVPEPQRDKANGLAGTASGISFLVTSVISGLLVGASGMYGVLVLGLVVTIAAMIHVWFLALPTKKLHTDGQNQKVDIKGTFLIVRKVTGLLPLILFTMFNNFLGGVFMALMDAYGLSLVSVQTWGFLWGVLSTGFIIGGILIARWGLGASPLRSLFFANVVIWSISSVFTLYPSIVLLAVGMYVYMCVVPYIEAAENTIIQKLVPAERQGRVFGFAHSVEQSASPLTAFVIGPLTQFVFIPFMTTGSGVQLIGSWFGTGPDRGIALVFTVTGVIGLTMSLVSMRSKFYHQLAASYQAAKAAD